jgi:hypothetical protein
VYCLINALHGFTTGIWEAHNKQLHRRDDDEAARIRTPIDAVFKLLHSQPHLLHSVDRFHCEQSLSDILKLRPLNKRRWVNRVRTAQKRYAKFHDRHSLQLPKYEGFKYEPRERPIVHNLPEPTPMLQEQTTLPFPIQTPQRRATFPLPMTPTPVLRQLKIPTREMNC